MKLLTEENKKMIPNINSQSGSSDPILYVKLFHPFSNWTWFIAELEPHTLDCYGYVCGFEREWGYFNLKEIANYNSSSMAKVERDRMFKPTPFSELKAQLS